MVFMWFVIGMFCFLYAIYVPISEFLLSLWYLCCGLMNSPEDVLTCSDLNNFVVLTSSLINYSNI